MKKLISIVLAVLMLMSVCTVTAFAANNGPSDEHFLGGDNQNHYYAFVNLYQTNEEMGITHIFYDNKADNTAVKGVTYDRATNTLTLKNVKLPGIGISANMMGEDFKIKVEGECEFDVIYVYADFYGGNLTITGSGTLTVNKGKEFDAGISLVAEGTDAKLNISDTVSLNCYGQESAVMISWSKGTDAKKVITVGSKALENVIAEKYNDKRPERIDGAYKEEEKSTRGKLGKCKTDPNGVYTITEIKRWVTDENGEYDDWMEEKGYWNPLIEIQKQAYNEYFKTYIPDSSFGTLEMTEEEFEKSDYSYITEMSTSPKQIPFYYSDAPLDQDWNYVAYIFNNPKDQNGLYYTGSYLFEDKTSENNTYELSKFVYDNEHEAYVIDSSEAITIPQFEASGYSYQMESEDNPKIMHYYRPDEDSYNTITYLVNNPDDPDGIYGMNIYPYTQEDTKYSYGRLVFNEKRNRYEPDDTFEKDYISPKEFTENGYEYVFEEEPVDFEYYEVNYGDYEVQGDSNGKKYAVSWNSIVFDYSEDQKAVINNKDYYILSENDSVNVSDLTRLFVERETDLFNFKLDSKELIIKGTGQSDVKSITSCKVTGIKAKTYNGKTRTQSVTVKDGTKTLKNGTDYSVSYKNNKNAGTATMIITGKGGYATFKINKAKNTMTVTNKKTVTANSKKATTIKAAITPQKAQGKVTYSTNNKKVTVKNGAMTVAKGLKKGKTVTVKVTVTAKGNSNYNKLAKTVSIKVKVK